MNERIEKLLVEAFFESDDSPSDKIYKINDAMIQKFAKLIVQECAGLVQGVPTDTMGYQSADQKIKQHFGVK